MRYPTSAGWRCAALALAVFVGGCGGSDDDTPVNPAVSTGTQAILDADPPDYASLQPLTETSFRPAGRIKPRTAAELQAAGLTNSLAIGGETTDRNFSTFSNWREFLNPLGASKVRVQSGWHDIEKVITNPPTYDFRKLDEIVDGSLAQKVKPFIFLGYGNENPGCTDCGTRGLGGAFPTGAGQERFLAFVDAIVTRYKDKVTDWQIWNEPAKDVDVYKVLLVDTAKRIKVIQPTAKITIGAFLATNYAFSCLDCDSNRAVREYMTTSLKYFDDNKGPTIPSGDIYVGFHPYMQNVDYDTNPFEGISTNNFLALVRSYGYRPRMDENGAPSTLCSVYAMCSATNLWTEFDQAKYNLRRVLGDLGRGIETSMFTITDLHYDNAKNTKGLLATGTWDPLVDSPFANGDQAIKRKKIAYGAFQNVTALFDDRLVPVDGHGCTVPAGYTVFAWSRVDAGQRLTVVSAWKKTRLPQASLQRTEIVVECTGLSMGQHAATGAAPYYVDMMDGRVHALPASAIPLNDAANARLRLVVQVGDWPAVVADQAIVQPQLRP